MSRRKRRPFDRLTVTWKGPIGRILTRDRRSSITPSLRAKLNDAWAVCVAGREQCA